MPTISKQNTTIVDSDAGIVELAKKLEQQIEKLNSLESKVDMYANLSKQLLDSVSRIEESTSAFVSLTNDLLSGARFMCRVARSISWGMDLIRKNVGVLLIIGAGVAWFTNQDKLLATIIKIAEFAK
jgi:uncharacterized phage infection (PIP) family protein YhgE